MTRPLGLPHLLAWLVMLLVSIANGGARDLLYGRHLDPLAAHQLSTLIGMGLLGVVMWVFLQRWPTGSARAALRVGLFWMALTVAFECLFFHYAMGHPWSVVLANYDLAGGRIWVLLLLWVALAPWLFHRLRRG
jgi:hypothetical protein